MSRTADQVHREILSLLPLGQMKPGGTDNLIAAVLRPLAEEGALIEAQAAAMMEQIDPRTATLTLPDFERVLGPEPCVADPQALPIEARQRNAHQRWTARGGASIPYFLRLAWDRGYEITITEFRPFECGISRCGETSWVVHGGLRPLRDEHNEAILDHNGEEIATTDMYVRWEIGPPEIRHVWRVRVSNSVLEWFRLGEGGGEVGVDPHVWFGRAEELECVFRRLKPAHTSLVFNYEGV